jgi:hypothetical protein
MPSECPVHKSRVQSIRAVSRFNSWENPLQSRDPIDFGVRLRPSLEWTSCFLPRFRRRNALSRTDGYWPYIQKGEDLPQQFTYGEFDFTFFAQLSTVRTKSIFQHDNSDDKVQSNWKICLCRYWCGTVSSC